MSAGFVYKLDSGATYTGAGLTSGVVLVQAAITWLQVRRETYQISGFGAAVPSPPKIF